MNIFVGGIPWASTEEDLREAFEAYGAVDSVTIIKDRETGKPRGFGFVEMPSDDEANAAIEGLNNSEMGGRTLTVNQARPREDRRGGGGYRGGGGGRGGYRGGGGGRGNDRRGGGGRRRDYNDNW
ncbi:MAG: RNA-binding protein [Ardenticatenaceae bacterium]|nr:RNA-binding protein [Ardenticatenaceae bacterium]